MDRAIAAVSLALALLPVGGLAEEPVLVPFPTAWEEPVGGPADLSFLLEAPAGRDGFVTVRDGHLAEADGSRLRIWGINLSAAAGLPRKEDAPRLAAILARHGLNGVRFHYFDRPAPGGILDASRDDTHALDPEQLERFDFLVAELKKRGIYTNINLNVARRYREGDGVRDHELLGFAKGVTHVDERLVELQKEYARQLLTHRNPYTGAEYRSEPAVAIVEMVNENSIVESWFSGRLLGKNQTKDPGTWTDIPASYERELSARYQAWLRERLSDEDLARLRKEAGVGEEEAVPRLAPEGFDEASNLRFQSEASFYIELEDRFFQQMGSFLRDDLGVRALLVGSSDHNHSRSGYPLLSSTAKLDVVDGHVYWQHPHYLEGRLPSGQSRFEIPNTPMVADPLHSTVVQLARSAVEGRPYTVSEVNHPFPHAYSAEGIPILAAYGALQDWDGIFWYTFEHARPDEWEPRARGHFDLRPDPVKMAQLAAGALLFLRGDVAKAKGLHLRSYSPEEVRESIRLPHELWPFFTPGFDHALPLRRRTRIRGFESGSSDSVSPSEPGPIVSDTDQLSWHTAQEMGLVTVETERSEATVGFPRVSPASLRHLELALDNDFAAVTLGALDDRPLSRSARLLLTAGARVANSGMRWNDDRTGLVEWGGAPTVIEPVRGRVVLRGLAPATHVEVTALDSGGRRTGVPRPARHVGNGWEIQLGPTATVWYVVDVGR
ncbi:MAG: hypothetical protein LJF30_07080 [Acidobacteria bacterium]|nr:hypothetical protein [Acidobacteriota bacterium]